LNYLTLENITKSYGEKTLFRNVSLQVNKGQKVALIAKNGSGKTTLMRVIAGTEGGEGEAAKVQFRKEIRIGYLPQEPEFAPGHNVLEAVLDSETETILAIRRYELALLHPNNEQELQSALSRMDDLKAWDYESKVKEILFKLNITNLEQAVTTLSGGQKKRIALAKLLIEEPEFLILDEPTNHLDLDMIEWLEVYLKQPNLTLFMVTHDRYFMERICDNIFELDRGELFKYTGGYKDFLEKRALRMENEAIELDKTQKVYKKELEWMRRMPQARSTKANARIDRFFDIEDKASKRLDADAIQIDVKGQRLGGKILELHYVSKAYGNLKLITDFHYKFKKGEKVGIVGKNGVGKTTLLHMLTGEERPDTGRVVSGETVVFGYYTQDGINLGKEDKRMIDFIKDIAEYIPLDKGQKLTAASLLERFLFTREQQQVYVSQLSGGERRRLYLLSILMRNPNFLILDEPTNDLDVMTLNVLEDFLQEFPGCVVIVSHDRFLLDKLCDHLFVFEGNGQIKDYNGRYMDYRAEQQELAQELRQQQSNAPANKTEQVQQVRTGAGLTNKEKNELKKLEREIGELEVRKAQLHEKFAQANLSLPEIDKMTKELQLVESSLEEKEMRWLELSE
jgi:ABC transport system ATP-binding/permease protein